MKVVEMRMLRYMCVHTRRYKIRNEETWDKLGVALVEDKMREVMLRWFKHEKRICTNAPMRRCERLITEKRQNLKKY